MQTQIDILKDELENEGIPTDSMAMIGRKVKLENATSDPNAKLKFTGRYCIRSFAKQWLPERGGSYR